MAFTALRWRSLDGDPVSRMPLAVLQGLILQLAWEPDLDIEAPAKTAAALIGTAFCATQPDTPQPPLNQAGTHNVLS